MADEPKPTQADGEPKPISQEEAAKWIKEAKDHAKEAQKLRERLNALEADKAKAAEDEAKKRGEFERLHGEEKAKREALEARFAAHDERLKAKLAALTEKLNDKQKVIISRIPETEDAIETAEDLLAEASKGNGGPPGTQPGGRSQEQFGGYATEAEFAARDWRGWKKWKETQRKH